MKTGALFLRISTPGLLAAAVAIVLGRSLQGAGDTRYPMLVTLVTMWGGFIPVTWFIIVYQGGTVINAWIGASFIYLIIGVLMWRRFESGKWKMVQIFR